MGDLQTQLTSILNSLVKVAVVELLRVVQDSAVELRLEVSQSKLENEALKIENESNQKRLKTLEAELSTAENRRCSYCRVEDDDASWLQQSESAHTVEKITVIENDEMQYLIKKEQHVDIHGRKDTPVSSDDENQPCPKVDMVFDKEWSQSLWQGGEAFKEEEEDSSGLEDEDTPGPSATHRQVKPNWAQKRQNVCVVTSSLKSVIVDEPDSSDAGIQKPEVKLRKLLVALTRVKDSEKDDKRDDASDLSSPESEPNNTEFSDTENISDFGGSEPGSRLTFEEDTHHLDFPDRILFPKHVKPPGAIGAVDAQSDFDEMSSSQCLTFEEDHHHLDLPARILVPKHVKPPGAIGAVDAQSDVDFDEMSNSQCKTDSKTEVKNLGRKRERKTGLYTGNVNYCFVCGEPQAKFSRHLKRHEKENAEIAYVLSLDIASRQRKVLLEKLRNRGNFQHNTNVIKMGVGCLKVKRKAKPNSAAKRYEPCLYCKGMFVWQDLRRHMGRCHCRPEGNDQKPHYGKKQLIPHIETHLGDGT
ncbi:uncharacterized protein LOC105020687 isoform X2 [Esox lucius]|uniref:uncharacterized protein LOC105020687 isoform X2 n=1 Tax=Esox lucius TaxID=8010 RepID=UPI0014772874|nr:uncharacterized protein LOC105020687 isoform X2 [Esox lucius]